MQRARRLSFAARAPRLAPDFVMKLRPFLRVWLPVLAWMTVTFLASGDMMSGEHTSRIIGPLLRWLIPDISPAALGSVQLVVRKSAHVFEYAVLGALLARAVLLKLGKINLRPALLLWVMAIVWAGLDEFHQSFVASRTSSPVDVMIDATGALLGLVLYWAATRGRSAPA